MKRCPFLNEKCLEEKCQLWTQVSEKSKTCALAATPTKITTAIYELHSTLKTLEMRSK